MSAADPRPHPAAAPRRGFASRVFRALLSLVSITAAALVLAWLLGRVLTDRYAFSQWMWWIPTPLVIAAALIGTLLTLRPSHQPAPVRQRDRGSC